MTNAKKSSAALLPLPRRLREWVHRVTALFDAAPRQVHRERPAQSKVLTSHIAAARAERSAGCGASVGWRRAPTGSTGANMRTQINRRTSTRLPPGFAEVNRASFIGEVAASLAYEITESISAARNNALAAQNFFNMQPPDLDEARKALVSLVGDVDRAADIVDRIREHIWTAPPRRERFDLNPAIDEAIAWARRAIAESGATVHTRLADDVFPVRGDRNQLQQVVLNLILNAVEAMGSVPLGGRELLVSTEKTEANGVLVTMRDSGPRIDAKHLERIFESCYSTKSGGAGMGLADCRSIVDAHGGQIWAIANEPRGAVFQFTLPGALENEAPSFSSTSS